jgi:filamentous hemagglutinin family protein
MKRLGQDTARKKPHRHALALLFGVVLYSPVASAQIVPDSTLPVGERSQITGNPTVQIEGGARRGGNLFHSFSQFSVPTGGTAYFNNATEVQNIFSRVTGNSVSNIDGLIRTNGSANLFLLNPNGVLFGQNARLDVRGSFVASSADRLTFENGFAFSASNPQAPPLLTISTPIGLQTGTNPGSIVVQGTGSGQSGLAVGAGKTLGLVGGEVRLDGGNLVAPGGRIELGSVGGESAIALTPDSAGWGLSYAGVTQFQDIEMKQAATVNTNGSGSGSIQVQGRRLNLTGGSRILALTQGTEAGKDLTVRTTESVDLIGFDPVNGFFSGLDTQADIGSTGNAGNITIDTGTLRISNGGRVSTVTFGTGKGGDLTVRAQSVDVSGFNSVSGNPTLLTAQADLGLTGNAGSLTIDTETLRISDGAIVATGTFGTGKGGDLTLRAQSVDVSGFNSVNGNPTLLTTQNNSGSTGNAGSLTIDTGTLRISDGAIVSTSTSGAGKGGDLTMRAQSVDVSGFTVDGNPTLLATQTNRGSTGDAGNLTIETGTLRISNGAVVSTATLGTGKGGDLTVRAQSVDVLGFNSVNSNSSSMTAQADLGLTGNAGNILLITDRLQIGNQGEIRTRSLGTGNAGNLTVQATSQITLADGASINANTNARQGNITLNTPVLLLRRGSDITTNATGNNNPGGDIQIDTRFLIAVSSENSDISANSRDFRGGNVRITADSIYGIQPRSTPTSLNDITATGATTALSGTIDVTTLDLDPTSSLFLLPIDLIDTSRLIVQGCPANQGNSFVVTGRGGLPPTPEQQLDDDVAWRDRQLPTTAQPTDGSSVDSSHQIIEANRWQRSASGEIHLVADSTDSTVQSAVPCNTRSDTRK